MRAWLALAALGASGIFAQAIADIPPWVVVVASLFGSGFVGRLVLARYEKRWEERLTAATAAAQEQAAATSAVEARELEERLQASLLARAEADYSKMVARLAEAEARAASAEAVAAQRGAEIERLKTKVLLLEGHLERLHDQLAAMSRGRQPERRTDDT